MTTPTTPMSEVFRQSAPYFAGSPLYQHLCPAIADDEFLLDLAARSRSGHQPPNMLFAAVHLSVRRHPDSELAQWYASVVGPAAARDPADAPPVFAGYCRDHRAELTDTIRTRLVQTNVVKRAAALRVGLAAVAARTALPVAYVEVGCSAGVLLRHDSFGYSAAGNRWGRPDSTVRIGFDWRAAEPPDLDTLPVITSAVGVDLHPADPGDLADRAWLEALVWPENRHEEDLLQAALALVIADPPARITGDVRDVLPGLVQSLPAGEPLVVFHSATRAHVSAADRPAFDAAITEVGRTRPLYRLSLESPTQPRFRDFSACYLLLLEQFDPSGERGTEALAIVEPHGEWILPLSG